MTKNKKKVTPEEKKSVLTTFIMMFPAMLITSLTALWAPLEISLIAIALFFYQAVLLKNFVNDHYRMA